MPPEVQHTDTDESNQQLVLNPAQQQALADEQLAKAAAKIDTSTAKGRKLAAVLNMYRSPGPADRRPLTEADLDTPAARLGGKVGMEHAVSEIAERAEQAEAEQDASRIRTGVSFNLRSLNPSHRQIMRMLLRGYSVGEIAKKLNIAQNAVARVVQSDLFQHHYQYLQTQVDKRVIEETVDVRSRIEAATGVAVERLVDMMNDHFTADKVKADICFDLLDRGGYKAPDKHEHLNVNVQADYKDVAVKAWQRRKARALVEANELAIEGKELPALEGGAVEDSRNRSAVRPSGEQLELMQLTKPAEAAQPVQTNSPILGWGVGGDVVGMGVDAGRGSAEAEAESSPADETPWFA